MPAALNKPTAVASWILQLAVAFILGQTLFFKFAGAPETVALFEVVGAEPFGRYAAGVLELAAVVLLLIPRAVWAGALLSLAAITGAIGAHVTRLGISIDPVALGNPALEPLAGPGLFGMAVFVFVASGAVLVIRRKQLPIPGRLFGSNGTDEAASAGEPT
jgi:putative oxidoreductase